MNHKNVPAWSLAVVIISALLYFVSAVIAGGGQVISAFSTVPLFALIIVFTPALITIILNLYLGITGVGASSKRVSVFISKVLRLKTRTSGIPFYSSALDNHSARIYTIAIAKIKGRWLNQIKYELCCYTQNFFKTLCSF